MSGLKGEGKAIQWLREHANYPHNDQCLTWPFSTIRGYGNFSYLGVIYYSHTYMCELVHGPRPTPEHQPAHSCGKGEDGCTNPRHLSWKTPSENQLDKRAHGTAYISSSRYKLTEAQVAEIRSLKGQKTHDEMARMFGVSRRNIGAILDGRSRGPERKWVCFMPEDDAKIRELCECGYSFNKIAKLMARPQKSISRRAKMMSIKPKFRSFKIAAS